ncbi:MAG: carbonic anhydrase family protein [Gammaproteobacteria bacterium]|nr:carbonic anhydrase family protein [Gammaproteobacteria bacterium]
MLKHRLIVAALAVALAPAAYAGADSKEQGKGHEVHWGYQGHEGPEHWGELKSEFGACKLGQTQSPIDIVSGEAKKGDLKPIEFHYAKMSNPEVLNNGHTIQVNYAPGSYAVMNGVKYDLLQFHFHAPSEETINGKHGDLNVHLVHKSAEGKLAVVGVLLNKSDKGNAVLNTIADAMPKKEGKQAAKGDINAADLLPADQAYFNFQGSLTTPPCSEGVNWHVMMSPVSITEAQLKAYTNIYPKTNRPIQPKNNRPIAASK